MNLRRIVVFLFLALFFSSFAVVSVFAASFESDIVNGFIKRRAITTEHFRIEFSDIIKNQPDTDGDGISDLIETVADAAEESWDVQIEEMGFDVPIEDELSRRIVLILDDKNEYLSSGAVGISSLLTNGDPYIALDPWMSDDYLQITVAHEFFHTIQFGYDTGFAYTDHGINWAEATAVWMEEKVYDDVDDYLGYLPDFFEYVDYSVFASITPTDSLYEYALSIWPIFLTEYFEDDNLIKDIWEDYFDSDTEDEDTMKVYDSVKDVVEDNDEELQEVFQEFTLWNLDWEDYEEGLYYPEVTLLEGAQGEYTLIDEYYAPALYGTNYLYFYNDDWEDDFYFHVVKSEGVSFVVTLVPVEGGDTMFSKAESVLIGEDEDLESEITVSDVGDAEAVIAVVSPLDSEDMDGDYYPFDEGYLYYYLAQFGDSIEEDIEADTEVEESSEKEGEESTMGEGDTRAEDELNLSVMSYDEDSVTLSWNRLTENEDIVGYEVWYGPELDYYSYVYEVDKAHTTYAKISDYLVEDEICYFAVYAIDEDGLDVGDPSNEIAVIPEEWLFEDLGFTDDHYDSISALVEEEIFEGYPDGTFGADLDINRAELLKILIEGQGITPDEDEYKNCFPDVTDDWYAKYVCYAEEQGWVQGYPDNTYKPGNTVNKVEALKILFNAYEAGLVEGTRVSELPFPDLGLKAWYSIYVYEAAELGILTEASGDDFNPENGRNRGDMAEELYRYLVVEELIKE